MPLNTLKFFFSIVKDVRNSLNDKNDNTIEALGAIRKAFNYTYDYLKNKNGEYVPNMNLADMWNDASTKVMKVDKDLGVMLGEKSRFWAHPGIYFELNRTSSILTLQEMTDQIERLTYKIR